MGEVRDKDDPLIRFSQLCHYPMGFFKLFALRCFSVLPHGLVLKLKALRSDLLY